MIYKNKRDAFSMLELVFVIVVLGIVASIGSEIISKVYKSYIIQRASYRSATKLELASLQIANRLTYAIPNTEIARRSSTDGTYSSLASLSNNNFQVLEWVGYDKEGFNLPNANSWSGFGELRTAVSTPTLSSMVSWGTHMGQIFGLVDFLSGRTKNLFNSGALFFPGTYTTNNIGYNTNNNGLSIITGRVNVNTFRFNPTSQPRTMKEHYKLAWSAYAIVSVPQKNGLWELKLYYNLQPWNGIDYLSGGVQNNTLLKNVSIFQFSSAGNTIRFKICQQEFIGTVQKITTCREKVVIR